MTIEETIIFLAWYPTIVTLEHATISLHKHGSVGGDIVLCKGRGSNSAFSTYSPRGVNF